MNALKSYPLALQLMMHTDGTVTELIKLLAQDNIKVVKLSENIDEKVLFRRIFLQGCTSKKNWLYAESKIHLKNLPNEFVKDLLEKSIPIGSLWQKYRIETFKELMIQFEETASDEGKSGFSKGRKLLCRTYQVFNQGKVIMEITEKFPLDKYHDLIP
jgi:chorismate-pyruvate lyase